MRNAISALALVLLCALSVSAEPVKKDSAAAPKVDPGLAPRIAEKHPLPPGLARQLGQTAPSVTYIAFDPRHEDRAWFLRNGRWVLEQGFDDTLRNEVHQILAAPRPPTPVSPPVPLPPMNVQLRIMAFEPPRQP